MPFSPLFMKHVEFKVATTDYAKELSSVLFESSSSQAEWKGLDPSSVYTESTPPTYTCSVKYAQDWDSATSFARWLYDNNGATVTATFKPKADNLPTFTAQLQIVAGPIGGDVDTFAESSVTFGSSFPELDDGAGGGGGGSFASADDDTDETPAEDGTVPADPDKSTADADTEPAEEDSDAALVP